MDNKTYALFKKDELEMATEIEVIDDILDQLKMTVEVPLKLYSFLLSPGVVLECAKEFACILTEGISIKLNNTTQNVIFNYCLER
mgnify:CR=1 FL=1